MCLSRFSLRNHPLSREFLAEFLGTFILLAFGEGSVAQTVLSKGTAGNPETIYWSWGIGVMMGVYVAGGISGGHLNPAVSLALACVKKFPWRKLPVYMLAQYLGAFVASAAVYIVYIDAINSYDGGNRQLMGEQGTAGIWSTYPKDEVSTINSFGDQIFGTALLLICVLAITDEKNMSVHTGLLPVSIGLIVVVIGMTFGYNCGYAINPARDLGPRIFTAIAGWREAPFSYRNYNWFWAPILGSHVGAIVGAVMYQVCIGFHWPEKYSRGTELEITSPQNVADEDEEYRLHENNVPPSFLEPLSPTRV